MLSAILMFLIIVSMVSYPHHSFQNDHSQPRVMPAGGFPPCGLQVKKKASKTIVGGGVRGVGEGESGGVCVRVETRECVSEERE